MPTYNEYIGILACLGGSELAGGWVLFLYIEAGAGFRGKFVVPVDGGFREAFF